MSAIGIQIILILLLVLVNAFFAASEIAVISINENKIRKMASDGSKRAQKLIKLIDEPSKFLATIQVGITLSGFLASAAAAQTFSEGLAQLIKSIKMPIPDNIINGISLFIVVIILSYITLVIGELVPKRLAMDNAQRVSMWVVIPLEFIGAITAPFVKFLTVSTNFFVKLLGGNPEGTEERITEEEIRLMVDVGEERGIIRETEKEMIDNIFEFDDTLISQIMTHRTDIVGLPIDAPLKEVIEIAGNEQFSRIPVYQDDIDNIIGILYTKDLLKLINEEDEKEFKLVDFIKKPFLVPKSKKTDELFKELQMNKNHMAIVIDEYGGTAGLVTIEDLLEEIVGNIFDEYDEEEKEIEKIDENTFVVNGKIELDNFNEFFNVHLPKDGYETLSGFIVSQIGKIPEENEKPIVEFQNLVIKVEKMEEKRITKVKVCKSK
ncbi:MAG: hemolysin family protein [Deltaproteobacteria bacterium]